MVKTIFKSILAAFSLTLMMLAVVYTVQSRDMRAHTPVMIGQGQAERPFLVDYTETRKELMFGFLRERFPNLNLPEPEAEPENALSLKSLHTRAMVDRAKQGIRP